MVVLRSATNIQARVIKALMIRELITRFGRENIGFLWVMAEPMMFAVFVGLLWRFERGANYNGISVFAFVATGYLPLVMFRSSINRAIGTLTANASLMYHRQVTILDLVLVRFAVEFIGHLMAYVFIGVVLYSFGVFPVPHDLGFMVLGWLYYSLFTLSVSLVVAPLSEVSEVIEKIAPVTVYMMIPFSGAFFMVSWLAPGVAKVVLYSPAVHAMEMMRYGVFGDVVGAKFDFLYPLEVNLPIMLLGLILCRRTRRTLVVE